MIQEDDVKRINFDYWSNAKRDIVHETAARPGPESARDDPQPRRFLRPG